jgi:hypothetical protein
MTTTVHLVGSAAPDTAQDVFATAGKLLGPYLRRLPDGEPGGRLHPRSVHLAPGLSRGRTTGRRAGGCAVPSLTAIAARRHQLP